MDEMNEIDGIADFDNNDWQTLENKLFSKEVRCYRVTINGKIYKVIGPVGTIAMLDKKIDGPKYIEKIVCSPRTYLDVSKDSLIPYGYWTCECDKDFIRTPYSSRCPKCDCSITQATKKCGYIEETKL